MDRPPPYSVRDELCPTSTTLAPHIEPEIRLDVEEPQYPIIDKSALRSGCSDDFETNDTSLSNVRRYTKRKKKIIIGCVVVFVLCAIIPSTVVATRPKKNIKCTGAPAGPFDVGGSVCEAWYSRAGIWNGSDIAAIQFTDDTTMSYYETYSVWVFAQDYHGDILRMRKASNDTLYLGEVVATDAKNSTRIAVIEYMSSQHVFYIDRNNYVREMMLYDNHWLPGPLSSMDLPASELEGATLQVCAWNHITQDSDYHYKTNNPNPAASFMEHGLQLWFATADDEFSQYSYIYGESDWTFDRSWLNVNGRAGLACQSWSDSKNTTSYIVLLDSNNTMEIYWKDTSTELSSTPEHPINQWTKSSSVLTSGAHPSTPIHIVNGYLMFQHTSNFPGIWATNVTWAAENSTVGLSQWNGPFYDLRFDNPNTKWTATPRMNTWQDPDQFFLLFQAHGDDIAKVDVSFRAWTGFTEMYPPEYRDN